MKTFAPHPEHVTILSGLRFSIDADISKKKIAFNIPTTSFRQQNEKSRAGNQIPRSLERLAHTQDFVVRQKIKKLDFDSGRELVFLPGVQIMKSTFNKSLCQTCPAAMMAARHRWAVPPGNVENEF